MTPPSVTLSVPARREAHGRHPDIAGPDPWPRPTSRPRRDPDDTASTATATHTAAAHTVTTDGRDPCRPGRIWAYLGIVVGAVVSVAANVAHSFVPPPDWPADVAGGWRPEPGAVLGAMFWPVALLITTEIMTRTAWPPGRAWLLLRFAGLLPVAAVAGIVSYLHLHGLLQHYHEAPLTCLIAPFSVDGLMVMASSALVAAGRVHPSPPRTTCPNALAAATPPGTVPHDPTAQMPPDTSGNSPVDGSVDDGHGWCEGCRARPATTTWTRPSAGHPFRLCPTCSTGLAGTPTEGVSGAWTRRPSARPSPPPEPPSLPVPVSPRTAARTSTAERVTALATARPDLSVADLAREVGVSTRTVRRHLAGHRTADQRTVGQPAATPQTATPQTATPQAGRPTPASASGH